MKNVIIMAGGASSRMKRSLSQSQLSEDEKNLAEKVHKSLIPLGKSKKPLLFYLVSNAVAAGITKIYLVTSPENVAFKRWLETWQKNNSFEGIKIQIAIQYLKKGYEKPLGTADAIEQTVDQYPELLKTTFIVCNGDNLYSKEAFQELIKPRSAPHALISYARSGLKFDDERIKKFAVMDINDLGYLNRIIEKPNSETVERCRDASGEIRVSMNMFSFFGQKLYPYLKNCTIHPIRREKELPEAIRLMNKADSNQIICYSRKENILDLTSAEDIASFNTL